MCARLLLTVAIVSVTVRGVSGQTRTADGVVALVHGDYDRAVEILKPIAEDWRISDPAAQFFMAGLYEHRRGVPADPMRACALYMRAASNLDDPFGREATELVRPYVFRSPEFNEECQALAFTGFDNGFEPVTFYLGPGHSVEWTLTAVTVTYDDRTKRVPMSLASPGARFLPLQHTELATGAMRSVARHFIELFLWRPSGMSGPWELQWHVFEIVGDKVIPIDTSGSLVTVQGDAPPPRDSFDVREYAVLGVDDEGYPEWAALKGPLRGTRRIESGDERREVREEAAASDGDRRPMMR